MLLSELDRNIIAAAIEHIKKVAKAKADGSHSIIVTIKIFPIDNGAIWRLKLINRECAELTRID